MSTQLTPDPDTLHDPPSASKRLGGVPLRTLEGWRYRGGGPAFVKVGRLVKYRESDLQAWLDGRTCERTADHTVRDFQSREEV